MYDEWGFYKEIDWDESESMYLWEKSKQKFDAKLMNHDTSWSLDNPSDKYVFCYNPGVRF